MRPAVPFLVLIGALVTIISLDDTPPTADLVFVNRGDVFTLDPQRMSYLQDFRMAYALYEGLVRWDNHDFTAQPAAAGMPQVDDDGLTYTFTIRDDAAWSNGDPVTAHDFVYSWRRALLPDTAADYSNMLFVVVGAEAFFHWRDRELKGFNADPWEDVAEARAETVLAVMDRFDSLLDAEALPREIALPAGDREALRREIDRVRRAADGGAERLASALADATALRDLREALDAPTSRAAEARWRWERAERRFDGTVGLTARDDRTLRVVLREPTAYFLDLLCFGICAPVHRPTVEGWPVEPGTPIGDRGWIGVAPPPLESCRWIDVNLVSGRLEQKHEWARPGLLVGNGPYVLTEWRYKRDMRLERNPYYHSPEMVRSDSVVALTIEDTNTRVLAFESGRIDWLSEVGAEYQADMIAERRAYETRHAERIGRLLEKGRTIDEALAALPPPGPHERRNIHVFPTFGTDFYSFNCRPELSDGRENPFHEAAVRRAFVMSVDKVAIVERATRLEEPIATTLIPPGSIPGYRSPAGLPHDPDAARAELAAAGWSDRDGDGLVENADGTRFPVIDLLWTTNTPRYKWISLELKAQWERELGVRIELRGADTKFYKEDLKQGQFMIARGRWYGDYGDPTTFLELCRTGDGNNDRGFSDPRVDDMLTRAATEADPKRRMRILEECEALLMDREVPMLVVCQLVQVYMYEPGRVSGLSRHPRLTQYLWQMEVDRR